jgi:hypothetical protein
MEQNLSAPAAAERPIETSSAEESIRPPLITLFTAFGAGPSYIFHVKEKGGKRESKLCEGDAATPDPIDKYWQQVFDGAPGWDSAPLRRYSKPLGERVSFDIKSGLATAGSGPSTKLEEWLLGRSLNPCCRLCGKRNEPLFREWLAESDDPTAYSKSKKRNLPYRLKKWWCRKGLERCGQSVKAARALKEAVAGAEAAYREKFSLSLEELEVTFFTPGVAVLLLRFKPESTHNHATFIKKYFTDETFEQPTANGKCINAWDHIIIESCKTLYKNLLTDAADRSARRFSGLKWTLTMFEPGGHGGSEPSSEFRYPLSFLVEGDYDARIERILAPVARVEAKEKPAAKVTEPSAGKGGMSGRRQDQLQQILERVDRLAESLGSQYERQSSEARIPYRDAEVYIDWSESLVKVPQEQAASGAEGTEPKIVTKEDRQRIETNFVIALASWLALFFMNKNSSLFLFEAFVGMSTGKPLSTADTVHKRNMAYKDVADASLPIRWTTGRKDLYLLEAIHRNWSSERWRRTIEERMKLLNLHYERLEEERREEGTSRIARFGLILTIAALASAVASVIALIYNDTEAWSNPDIFPNYKLRRYDFPISLVAPLVLGLLFYAVIWLWDKRGRWLRRGRKRK